MMPVKMLNPITLYHLKYTSEISTERDSCKHIGIMGSLIIHPQSGLHMNKHGYRMCVYLYSKRAILFFQKKKNVYAIGYEHVR